MRIFAQKGARRGTIYAIENRAKDANEKFLWRKIIKKKESLTTEILKEKPKRCYFYQASVCQLRVLHFFRGTPEGEIRLGIDENQYLQR